MDVYQCRSCLRIIGNDLSFVKEDSNGIVIGGVEECISLVPSKDPEVYYLKCVCKNKVGEGYKKGADGLTYRLRNDSIIRCLIKKLVGHIRGNPEECESDFDSQMTSKVMHANDMKRLAAKVEELEKELISIKKEKYSEKLETLCALMSDNMASLTRMAELLCEVNPDMDLRSAVQQIF